MINKKNICGIIGIAAIIGIGIAVSFILPNNKKETPQTEPAEQTGDNVTALQKHKTAILDKQGKTKKTDLYNSTDKIIPLSAISQISDLPEQVQTTVNKFLDESENGIYFMQLKKDSLLLITSLDSNETEQALKRHNFRETEISLNDGSIVINDITDENLLHDKWEYENEFPLSHMHYNDKNELLYEEHWNYSENEPIKYKKTNKDGHVMSLRKEVIDNGTNLREEHIFYDSNGNVSKNISFNYEGTDLTRFTYYNSNSPESSAMIVSEYEDGVKLKESLYSSDYKLKNTYVPKYVNGQKTELNIFDENNNLIETIVESH